MKKRKKEKVNLMKLIHSLIQQERCMVLSASYQVGETTGNEIRPILMSRIMIPIRLCSLPLHSPCLCLLLAIELCMEIMLGECMRDAQVIN